MGSLANDWNLWPWVLCLCCFSDFSSHSSVNNVHAQETRPPTQNHSIINILCTCDEYFLIGQMSTESNNTKAPPKNGLFYTISELKAVGIDVEIKFGNCDISIPTIRKQPEKTITFKKTPTKKQLFFKKKQVPKKKIPVKTTFFKKRPPSKKTEVVWLEDSDETDIEK
jgi:hypothetical protein